MYFLCLQDMFVLVYINYKLLSYYTYYIYSLFAWTLALLLTVLEEKYDYQQFIHINIPSTLPLILLGLPSAVAQGSMFWEYTPLYNRGVYPYLSTSSHLHSSTVHNSGSNGSMSSVGVCKKCVSTYFSVLHKIILALPKVSIYMYICVYYYSLYFSYC